MATESSRRYSLRDKRNNIHYLKSGELFYPAAALGIVQDTVTNNQRLLSKGIDHIISTLVGPDGKTVFLGEQAERPCIYVWDTSFNPPILIKTIRQCLRAGVETMALSPSGRYLLAACIDEQRTFVIYDLKADYALTYCDWLGSDELCAVDFNTGMPLDTIKIFGSLINTFWVAEDTFVLTGDGVAQIYVDTGDNYEKHQFEVAKSPSSYLLCAAVCPNGDVVCGTSAGEFLVWRKSIKEESSKLCNPKLHSGPLDAIAVCYTEFERYVLTGGKDCRLVFLDEDYKIKMNFDIYSIVPYCLDGQIRAIAVNPMKKTIALGLICGEIYELTYK
jgi:WD40 repeat protein